MIINAQKDDAKLQEIVQLVSIGDKTDYVIDESGDLLYEGIVPSALQFRKFQGRNLFYEGGGGGENCNTPKYTLVVFKHN